VALHALSMRPCELMFLLFGVETREPSRVAVAAEAPACLDEDSISSEYSVVQCRAGRVSVGIH
jgi:hypothetical protein